MPAAAASFEVYPVPAVDVAPDGLSGDPSGATAYTPVQGHFTSTEPGQDRRRNIFDPGTRPMNPTGTSERKSAPPQRTPDHEMVRSSLGPLLLSTLRGDVTPTPTEINEIRTSLEHVHAAVSPLEAARLLCGAFVIYVQRAGKEEELPYFDIFGDPLKSAIQRGIELHEEISWVPRHGEDSEKRDAGSLYETTSEHAVTLLGGKVREAD